MLRQIATVSTGTLSSRLLGFARDGLIAALLGAGVVADAFLLAFQFVNVARRLLSEGALNAALVPTYLRIRESEGTEAAAAFAGRLLGTLGLTVFVLTVVLATVLAGMTSFQSSIMIEPAIQAAIGHLVAMLPYLAFAGCIAVMAGVLNANASVALTSFSPLVFNLLLIGVVLVLLASKQPEAGRAAFILAITVGVAGVLQLGFLAVTGTAMARPVRVSVDPETRHVFRRALPVMVIQSGPQLLLVGAAFVASASPSAVSWLYFASRLIELPLGMVGMVANTVLLPRMSGSDSDTNHESSSTGLQLAIGLTLPAALGLAILAQPIVALLFEHGAFTPADTSSTALALMLLAPALPAQALAKIYGAIVLARGETTAALGATLIALAVTLLIAAWAFPRYGYPAAAVAISVGAWTTAALLGTIVSRRRLLAIDAACRRNLMFIGLASAAMAVALLGAQRLLPAIPNNTIIGRLTDVGTFIALGLIVYAAALHLSGVLKLQFVRRAFGRGL